MDILESIKIIRNIDDKKRNNEQINAEELEQERDAYDYLFQRMNKHIYYLISKNNYLPGMSSKDIEQELRLHLLDSILPRKSKRIRIDKKTGEKNIMKVSLNINQPVQKIENYLKFSLTHKYYRISRDFYSWDKKTIKDFLKLKEEGKTCQGMHKHFRDPLNNFNVTIINEDEENDGNDDLSNEIGESRLLLRNTKEDLFNNLEIECIKEKISNKAREILELALGCNKRVDFSKYIKSRGDAKYTLEREVIPVLVKYYGITKNINKRIRRKKQSTKESLYNVG